MNQPAQPRLSYSATFNRSKASAAGVSHPVWLSFIEYCAQIGHGEIAKLKIQDGVPVIAEIVTKKVRFSAP